jgi:hypothetical protein
MPVRIRLLALPATVAFMVAPSAQAHFLQTDPVGYKDNPDLYAYVGDDPTNKTDPTGKDAYIQVYPNGQVHINIPIAFSGDAASNGNITRITNDIQNKWSGNFGPYSVTTTVQSMQPGQAISGQMSGDPRVVNNGVITNGPTPDNGGHSYVGNNYDMHMPAADVTGHSMATGDPNVSTEAVKGSNTAAHEAGHLMGLPDVSGDHGGIMDGGSGTRVTPGDIGKIISNPVNIVHKCNASGACQ